MEEGLRGGKGACSTLHRNSDTPSATHNQIGPLWHWFLSGWACAHSRPLWVSPTTSPVRLGVFPAATPKPMGVLNQRFEALFPHARALGYTVCFTPRHSSQFICVRVWGRRVCWWSDCLPRSSHTPASLRPATATRVLSAPVPVSAPPTGLDGCLFFISLVSDFLPLDFLSVLVVRGGAVCLPTRPSWF